MIKPDGEPEKGFFYRSDHFEFAKQGVESSHCDFGFEFAGGAPDFGTKLKDDYTANHYHKVSDEVKPDWDYSGGAEDAQLLFHVGFRAAQGDRYPEWKQGAEFKAKREAMLRKQ